MKSYLYYYSFLFFAMSYLYYQAELNSISFDTISFFEEKYLKILTTINWKIIEKLFLISLIFGIITKIFIYWFYINFCTYHVFILSEICENGMFIFITFAVIIFYFSLLLKSSVEIKDKFSYNLCIFIYSFCLFIWINFSILTIIDFWDDLYILFLAYYL